MFLYIGEKDSSFGPQFYLMSSFFSFSFHFFNNVLVGSTSKIIIATSPRTTQKEVAGKNSYGIIIKIEAFGWLSSLFLVIRSSGKNTISLWWQSCMIFLMQNFRTPM